MPYVNGFNLWGGRSCLPEQGYTWRDDHGRIVHTGLGSGRPRTASLAGRRRAGAAARAAAGGRGSGGGSVGWWLSFDFDLTAPPGRTWCWAVRRRAGIRGRADTGGSSGGPGRASPRAFTASGSDQAQGSAEPLDGADRRGRVHRWSFVGSARWMTGGSCGAGELRGGVCRARLRAAADHRRPASALSRRIRVLVADGEVGREQIGGARRPADRALLDRQTGGGPVLDAVRVEPDVGVTELPQPGDQPGARSQSASVEYTAMAASGSVRVARTASSGSSATTLTARGRCRLRYGRLGRASTTMTSPALIAVRSSSRVIWSLTVLLLDGLESLWSRRWPVTSARWPRGAA